MTSKTLFEHAMASVVFSRGRIEASYALAHLLTHSQAVAEIKELCISHERLQWEYDGVKKLYEELEFKHGK